MVAFPPFPWLARREREAWCRSALARDVSLESAVEAIAHQLKGCGDADMALVFASTSYASDLPRLLPLLQQQLQATHWLGSVGGGVVGTESSGVPRELEQQPALSVTLLSLPGATFHPFAAETATLPDLDGPAEPWRRLVLGEEAPEPDQAPGSMLVMIDPGSTRVNDLISGLDYGFPGTVKVGGIAGQHSAPVGSLLYGDGVRGGAVGCLIGGAWRIQPVVAQGCRPIGPVLEVEQAQRNVVIEVRSGDERRSPVAALQAILTQLTPDEREQVKHSLFLGVGQSDFNLASFSAQSGDPENAVLEPPAAFLVRNLIGVDPRNGAVAVGERMRVGQKVQFQLRDGVASSEESRQLLSDLARVQPEPLMALLFACLGRGQGLYGQADGDVGLCRESFSQVPIAGVFCNGEIGPVAGTTHLHGYTASWGFLVPADGDGA